MVTSIHLLDGGFGTTLEDVFGKDISGALWSASMIDKEPLAIVAAHKAFLGAGSDVILTSTYQCAFETFERAGYSESDAVVLMRSSVHLASRAREETRVDDKQARIALSLGPFGATLSPTQEYDGCYPPPYGPRGYTTDGSNVNAFKDVKDERAATYALADFHYKRLKVFTDDDVWSVVNMIVFETVPLRREIYAIRMAMARLRSHLSSQGLTYNPWLISTVWPMGIHPGSEEPNGRNIQPEAIALALLSDHGAAGHSDTRIEMAIPDGIGVNCTHISHLDVLSELRVAVSEMKLETKPSLALYPNGGGVYDIFRHLWISEEDVAEVKISRESWAQRTGQCALIERDSGVWSEIFVGGCCRTTPEHIRLLAEYLDKNKNYSP